MKCEHCGQVIKPKKEKAPKDPNRKRFAMHADWKADGEKLIPFLEMNIPIELLEQKIRGMKSHFMTKASHEEKFDEGWNKALVNWLNNEIKWGRM